MNKNQKWFFPWKTNSSQHQSLHQQGLAWNWPGPALRAHLHHLTREHQRITGQRLRCEKVIGEHRHQTKKNTWNHHRRRGLWPFGFCKQNASGKKCSQTWGMQSNMMPIKDDYKMITVKTPETLHHALRDVWWGKLYQSCPRILGYELCKGPNLFVSFLLFWLPPWFSWLVPCHHKKWLTIGSGFNHKQCQLHGIEKIEPSISAVLRVGALRRLGGIPCSLGRPPSRKRYERGSCGCVVCLAEWDGCCSGDQIVSCTGILSFIELELFKSNDATLKDTKSMKDIISKFQSNSSTGLGEMRHSPRPSFLGLQS